MYAFGANIEAKFSHSHASRYLDHMSIQWYTVLSSHQAYIGHPSAISRHLYLSRARLSGPLFRIACLGREPTGKECKSGMMGRLLAKRRAVSGDSLSSQRAARGLTVDSTLVYLEKSTARSRLAAGMMKSREMANGIRTTCCCLSAIDIYNTVRRPSHLRQNDEMELVRITQYTLILRMSLTRDFLAIEHHTRVDLAFRL